MNWLSLIMISALSLNVFASPFDPPANVSADEKASWVQARCKWRMLENPQMIGYEMELHITDVEQCFLEARMVMITTSQDADYKEADRARYTKEWDVIWDSQTGDQQLCTMVPLKTPYSTIDEEVLKAAFIDKNPKALKAVKQIADENISLDCSVPTQ